MLVVAGVGDVDADFVQQPRPAHILQPISQLLHRRVVRMAEALHELLRGGGNAVGLILAGMVAVLEFGGGLVAHVFVELAADEVVKHAVAQRGFGDHHFLDFQLFKSRHHHGQPARKHFEAVGLQAFELGFFGAARFADALGQLFHGGIGDVGFRLVGVFGGNHITDGFGRTGGADGEIPAGAF